MKARIIAIVRNLTLLLVILAAYSAVFHFSISLAPAAQILAPQSPTLTITPNARSPSPSSKPASSLSSEHDPSDSPTPDDDSDQIADETTYSVVRVVDGDTIDVSLNGQTVRIRLIGINAPESVDPTKPTQCYGVEASEAAKKILDGEEVSLESDPSQDYKDKYWRLLRYVYLSDGTNFNQLMLSEGDAYEYTFIKPYKYQEEFKAAEQSARQAGKGLWSSSTCQGKATSTIPANCKIKGNITAKGDKIYHIPGDSFYAKTVVNMTQGERWFCSEAEAQAAGWRKSR